MAPADGGSNSKIQLFFTVAPLGGLPLRTVSVRAAYGDRVGDVVRGAAQEALAQGGGGAGPGPGGSGDASAPDEKNKQQQPPRLVAFWHSKQIDLDDAALTVEAIGWHTGFGIKAYELPRPVEADASDADADFARVRAAVDFFPPVERVVVPAGKGLVLREVSGDAAIEVVQAQARERARQRAEAADAAGAV